MQPDSADTTSSPTSTPTTTAVTGANEAVATTTATTASSTGTRTLEYVMINEVVIAQNYIGKGAAREGAKFLFLCLFLFFSAFLNLDIFQRLTNFFAAYAHLFAQPSLARPLQGGGDDTPATTPTPTAATPETTPAANQQTDQQTNTSVLFWAFVVTVSHNVLTIDHVTIF